MVYESLPWKQDLLDRKRLLIKYNTDGEFAKNYDKAYTEIEKGLFYSAFIIRKLIECKCKLSDEADNYTFRVQAIKPLTQVDYMHRWPDGDSHEWEKEKTLTVKGKEICNWLIHSYIFFTVENVLPVSHFCVSSDLDKNKYLYMVSMDDWLDYMDFIASDHIQNIISEYDKNKKEYIHILKQRG